MTTRKIICVVAGIILIGAALGFWTKRAQKASVDLGAASTQYVADGVLRFADNNGVEIANFGISHIQGSYPLAIAINNGPNEFIGKYESFDGALTVYTPFTNSTKNFGYVEFRMDLLHPYAASRQIKSIIPNQQEVSIPVRPAYIPRYSLRWWWNLFSPEKQSATLQSELPSEDSRLVHRDGVPFAVCGYDYYGTPAIVFVSADYKPEEKMYFQVIQSGLAAPAFEIYDRKGNAVALLETSNPRGPSMSFSSAYADGTAERLFNLDSTGTKLVHYNPLLPASEEGIIDWLARPMYRARLPIRLIDAQGKVLWSSGKAGMS